MTAEKTSKPAVTQHQTATGVFFRKAEGEGFFGGKEAPSFFGGSFVQAKLSVSHPDDPQEKEADAVADQVMRMPEQTSDASNIQQDDTSGIMRLPEAASLPITAPEEKDKLNRMEEEESVETAVQPSLMRKCEQCEEEEKQIHAKLMRMPLGKGKEEDKPASAISRKAIDSKHIQPKAHGPPSLTIQRSGRAPPVPSSTFESSLQSTKGGGAPISTDTRTSLESRFGADFSSVRIHTGTQAESLSSSIQAQAFTHGGDIYFNSGKYAPNTASGGHLLAHELTHTIQQGASPTTQSANRVAPKLQRAKTPNPQRQTPNIQRLASERPVPSQLNNAVATAKGEEGKVNAGTVGPDGFRTGWEHLTDYFKTTLGADKVIGNGGTYVQGAVAEQDIKKRRDVSALPPAHPDIADKGNYKHDAMPSWCGIFVFWALHKGGVPMKPWMLGGQNVKPDAAYPPNYIPKAGDIAYRNDFSHFALVEKASGDTITTVNGNTAGEDNLGGQVQTRDHPRSGWTAFFDPLMLKDGPLSTGETNAEAVEPLGIDELRKRLFRKEDEASDGFEDAANDEATSSTESIQTKPELGNYSVQPTGALQRNATATEAEEPLQKKEEEKQEDSEIHSTHELQSLNPKLQTPDTVIHRSWLGDAWNAVGNAVSGAIEWAEDRINEAKEWILQQASEFVSAIPGFTLLTVILERNPITGQHVARTGTNMLEAGLNILPLGSVFRRVLISSGTYEEAANFVLGRVNDFVNMAANIGARFSRFIDGLSLSAIGHPQRVLEDVASLLHDVILEVVGFITRSAEDFLEMIKRVMISLVGNFIRSRIPRLYPLLRVALGHDPITNEEVPRNGINILNALFEVTDEGRSQRERLQENGAFARVAAWIDRGISVFTNLYHAIRTGFSALWDVISIETLAHPTEAFERIYNHFAQPVIQVWQFVRDTAATIIQFIKDALLSRLSAWARGQRGYFLITLLIHRDPFTNEPVPFTIENVIHAFMSLMDGGEEQFQQMKQTGAIARTTDRIHAAVRRLNFTVAYIVGLFTSLWSTLRLSDLANIPALFMRVIRTFAQPVIRLVNFVVEIIKIVVEVILRIMQFPVNLVQNIIRRAMEAWDRIKRDPIGFLKNLLRAIKQGFVQFFDHILDHLLFGLTGWLMAEMRDAGIPTLSDFSLRGVIAWVMEVLHISMEAIWAKLAAHPRIGPERVARLRGMIGQLEGIWTFIRDVQERGMAAIWDKIQEQLSNLWDTVLDAVKNWVMERIITQVTARLLSMLDPTGIMAVINGAIALYSAIQSFVRYLREMLEVVNSFVEGLADIAAGNVSTAANYLEQTMRRSMPIVIGFLANQVGLSGIGRRVGEMIVRVRTMVDNALTWLVNRAVHTGFAVFDRLLSMGRSAVGAVVSWARGVLGLQQPFTTPDNVTHRIYFAERGGSVQLMLNPTPAGDYHQKMNEITVPPAPNDRVTVPGVINVPLQRNGAPAGNVSVSPGGDGKASMSDLKRGALEVATHIDGLITSNMRTETDADEVRDQTPDFNASLVGLSSITKYLLSAEPGVGLLPVSPVPQYGGLINGFASRMDVSPLTRLGVPGTGVSVSSPDYQVLLLRRETAGGRSYYIAGHLLNNNVHGSGSTWANLTPITQAANRLHESQVESKVKRASDAGLILHYTVDVDYGIPLKNNLKTEIEAIANWATIPALNEKHQIIMAEAKLPNQLRCTLKQLKADGTDLPTSDPSYDAQYNINGAAGIVRNVDTVSQDSLNEYYLRDASSVAYKTKDELTGEARLALVTNPGFTWNQFYNNPANKGSIDNLSTADKEEVRNYFRKLDIMAAERERIGRLMEIPTWASYSGRTVYTGDILNDAEKNQLHNLFFQRMQTLKGFLISSLTTYTQTRMTDPNTQWGEFRRTQSLNPRTYEYPIGSGTQQVILSEADIQTFKTAVFDPRIAALQAAAPPNP